MLLERRMLTTVWFKYPIEGIDETSGDTFISNRHFLSKGQVVEEGGKLVAVAESGELIAEWPADSVLKVDRVEPREPTSMWQIIKDWRLSKSPRQGSRWSDEETSMLQSAYESCPDFKNIDWKPFAAAHERSVSAIHAKLLSLGRIHFHSE